MGIIDNSRPKKVALKRLWEQAGSLEMCPSRACTEVSAVRDQEQGGCCVLYWTFLMRTVKSDGVDKEP